MGCRDSRGAHSRFAGDGDAVSGLIGALLYVVLAPVLGGLLGGVDRIVSARMQSRVGPPVAQPFYDVLKLLSKRPTVVNHFQNFYVACFLVFVIVTGAIFFSGGDILLAIFALTVGAIFLVLAAYAPNSPYSNIGAERELLQMMAYEPMLLVVAMGIYVVTDSFNVREIVQFGDGLLAYLPAAFLGFLLVLTIKLRKSPFDLSTSHHAHQELVKGVTTELSGPSLAIVEVAHWYENVFLLGFVYLFFAWLGPVVAIAATFVVYLFEVLVDNVFARLTWRITVKLCWLAAGLLGCTNLLLVYYMFKGYP